MFCLFLCVENDRPTYGNTGYGVHVPVKLATGKAARATAAVRRFVLVVRSHTFTSLAVELPVLCQSPLERLTRPIDGCELYVSVSLSNNRCNNSNNAPNPKRRTKDDVGLRERLYGMNDNHPAVGFVVFVAFLVGQH